MPGPVIEIQVYDDEQELIAGLRRQDPDACTCMVKRYAPLVYARAMRLVNDPDEAEGILQTTFIKACAAIDTFDGDSALGTWIYRIATNEGLMWLRSHKPQLTLDALHEGMQPDQGHQHGQSWAVDPQKAALTSELRRQLDQAIRDLPEPLRLVVILRDLEGLSTEETAAELGLSPGAVKVRLHRARQRLREALTVEHES
jgi:RNA polymerase sigma-70 factor, ECF subfamily